MIVTVEYHTEGHDGDNSEGWVLVGRDLQSSVTSEPYPNHAAAVADIEVFIANANFDCEEVDDEPRWRRDRPLKP